MILLKPPKRCPFCFCKFHISTNKYKKERHSTCSKCENNFEMWVNRGVISTVVYNYKKYTVAFGEKRTSLFSKNEFNAWIEVIELYNIYPKYCNSNDLEKFAEKLIMLNTFS